MKEHTKVGILALAVLAAIFIFWHLWSQSDVSPMGRADALEGTGKRVEAVAPLRSVSQSAPLEETGDEIPSKEVARNGPANPFASKIPFHLPITWRWH